jgi:hypothetical protein
VKALKMQLRRSARLLTASGALLLATTALTSCGFDYATDRVYTPGAGTNDQNADVDVLSAVVVSAEDGSGTLITTFSNNSQKDAATIDSIEGAGDTPDLQIGEFEPIEVPAGGYVNLADADQPITVEGDYDTGEFLTLSIGFGDGTSTTIDLPSVTDCHEYAGLDATAETGTPESECTPEAPASETEH